MPSTQSATCSADALGATCRRSGPVLHKPDPGGLLRRQDPEGVVLLRVVDARVVLRSPSVTRARTLGNPRRLRMEEGLHKANGFPRLIRSARSAQARRLRICEWVAPESAPLHSRHMCASGNGTSAAQDAWAHFWCNNTVHCSWPRQRNHVATPITPHPRSCVLRRPRPPGIALRRAREFMGDRWGITGEAPHSGQRSRWKYPPLTSSG